MIPLTLLFCELPMFLLLFFVALWTEIKQNNKNIFQYETVRFSFISSNFSLM